LPASMWAMMPMFRVLFNGDCLGITKNSNLVIWSSGYLVIDWSIE
jgi:hypothetical protein